MSLSPLKTVLIAFLFFPLALSAQFSKTTFKGNIVDESNLPIPGATLMVLHAADSVLAQFASSDAQGQFIIKNVPKGEYLLNITFLGLAAVFQPITSGAAEEVDLGKITMKTQSSILSEVEVKADLIPIEITKDTISYNADAFQTQPNAVVEDLLKKLPGIEVASDGSIKAQGEDVQRVTVDGKEFFGDDPKMATKNLPARAVKKVKVYDRKSDIAQFSGVDDGEREKTIDLQLKEEFKKGLFGKGEVGFGTDDRYTVRANANKFSKTTQLSFIGQLNNINEQNFSFNDMMSFSGGMRQMMGGGGGRPMEVTMASSMPYSESNKSGLVTTGAGGVNFTWQKNKKLNLRSSYFYNHVDNTLTREVFRQNLSGIPFNADENAEENTQNSSHRFTLDSDFKLDTTQQIFLNGSASIGNGDGVSGTFLQNMIPQGPVESESNTNENNTSENLSLRAGGSYVKKFGSRGRNVSGTINFSKNDQDNTSELQALTEYFTTGSTESLDQLQFANSLSMDWSANLYYTEPLSTRRFLEFGYTYGEQQSDYDKDVADLINEEPVPNELFSDAYTSEFKYHRPGITFRYTGNIHNINAGLQYQISELVGHLNQNENEINKNYYHFLPRAMWRYDIGNGKNMRFNYSTRVNQPSITQLSPVIDNSDPLRLYVGNPDLNAEFNHNVSFNYHSFTQFSSTSFFASISSTFTKDKIITSRTVDEQFREVLSPFNIDEESRFNFYSSFGRPFKPIHSRFNINASASYTNTQNYINNELLDLNRWSRTGGITFSNLNSEVVEFMIGGSWTFTDSYYKTNETLNQSTILHNYSVDLTLTLWKKWRVNGYYNYNLYTSNEFGDDQALPLLGGSISRYVLPGDKGQIILSVFDALDENRGLSRNVDVNYIEEIRSNSIGRYGMLKFIYNLNGPGKEPPGAVRIIEHRR